MAGLWLWLCLWLPVVAVDALAPWHWETAQGNNVAASGVTPSHRTRPPVYYHGLAGSAQQCAQQCALNATCASYAWTGGTQAAAGCGFARACFFRSDTAWAPVSRAGAACRWVSARKVRGPAPPPPAPRNRTSLRNVLYIMVDDLRAQLSCYGHNDTVRTPNVDRLAATGALFQHAFVQIAVCSPSRTVFLTGLRPHQTNVLNFRSDFRRATPGGSSITTLPQFFKDHGLLTTGLGKTFHPGLPANYDEPLSWSPDFPYVAEPSSAESCGNGTHGQSPFCSEGPRVGDDGYVDGLLVSEAVRQLGVIAARYTPRGTRRAAPGANPLTRAFFMAVGLHRPHMDWVTPPDYLARQPPAAAIKLARHPVFPNATTGWAAYNCTELTGRPALAELGAHIEPGAPLPAALAQTIRRHYYAAVEYMDSQVGRLLNALGELGLEGSTAVVFHGDHGWKLGELGQWCKETVFENDARIPLLIRAPWLGAASAGRRVPAVVETVDIFPTLAELTGVGVGATPPQLQGHSLVPLLAGAGAGAGTSTGTPARAAFTVYPRWKQWDNHSHCFRPYAEIGAMALSVRTAAFRLSDWVAWNASAGRPEVQRVLASELYDHRGDTGMGAAAFDLESSNLAGLAEYAPTVAALRALLHEQFGDWPAWGPGPLNTRVLTES